MPNPTSTQVLFAEHPCIDPLSIFQEAGRLGLSVEHWWGKPNAFHCARGKQPGTGYVLLPRESAVKLDVSATTSQTLEFVHGGKRIKFLELYVVHVSSLYADAVPTSDKAAYLVEFRDLRSTFSLSTVDAQYNVRRPAPSALTRSTQSKSDLGIFYQNSIQTGGPWTWKDMILDLWGKLPGSKILNVNATNRSKVLQDTIPEGFIFRGVSVWDALFTVLEKLNLTIIYQPCKAGGITPGFRLEKLGSFQTYAENFWAARTKAFKDFPVVEDSGTTHPGVNYPATIRVMFHRLDQHYGTEVETPDLGNWSQSAGYYRDVSTRIKGALSGTVKVIWDDLPAIFSFSGKHLNKGECSSQAERVANDFTNRILSPTGRHRVLSGLFDAIPIGSKIGAMTWYSRGDADGMCTEVFDFVPGSTFQNHSTTSTTSIPVTIPDGPLLPPDFARKTHPLYPRIIQPVKIVSDSMSGKIEREATGVYAGEVLRSDPEGDHTTTKPLEYVEDCWLWLMNAVDDDPPTEGSLQESLLGKWVSLGRLAGSFDNGGDVRPLYLVEGHYLLSRGYAVAISSVSDPKTDGDWEENEGDPRVWCKLCDKNGKNLRGEGFWIGLPRLRGQATDLDPSVYKEDVIEWEKDNDGNPICKSPYLWSAIGDFRWIKDYTRIQTGWRESNGEDEAWDAKHRVLMARDPDGQPNEKVAKNSGGYLKHGITENNHPDHPNHLHDAATLPDPPGIALPYDQLGGNAEGADFATDVADGHIHTITDNANAQVWNANLPSTIARLPGGGAVDLLNHYGSEFDSNTDTDNRMPFLVAILIERYK